MYPPLGRGWGGDGGGGGDESSSGGVLPKAPGTKRVLILMSDTGGGHRASAEALKSAFQILYGASGAGWIPAWLPFDAFRY